MSLSPSGASLVLTFTADEPATGTVPMTETEVDMGLALRKTGWPAYGWLGLGLVIVFWGLNWSLPGLRTHWCFFPLWLGYCLTVDALVLTRKGSSQLTRNPGAYVRLFVVSALAWWLFEVINWRTQNWIYEGRQYFTDLQYLVLASVSFSTVMPAVFGTAELVSTFDWVRRIKRGPLFALTPTTLLVLFTTGCLMLALLLLWPRYFFPFVWLSLYFMLEPLNVWLGNPSLAQPIARGDWRPVFALWIGCLACGFLWEMWNVHSYPKWVYRVPFFSFLHLFEMPLLGYGGYIPFSMELFALYHLAVGLLQPSKTQDLIQIMPGDIMPGKGGELTVRPPSLRKKHRS